MQTRFGFAGPRRRAWLRPVRRGDLGLETVAVFGDHGVGALPVMDLGLEGTAADLGLEVAAMIAGHGFDRCSAWVSAGRWLPGLGLRQYQREARTALRGVPRLLRGQGGEGMLEVQA